MGNGVPMNGSSAPPPGTTDGRNEVGANAPFDFHELRIPSVFLEGFDASVFVGGSAFGSRASLFDFRCPLAIDAASQSRASWVLQPIGCRAGIEVPLDPFE